MKARTGFVSNSSSSSFLIMKKDITAWQLHQIKNAEKVGAELLMNNTECAADWTITETDMVVEGWTYMDNFDMLEFLRRIGIPEDAIATP